MESTFGLPHYRLPPRSEVLTRLLALVESALADGKTPVIHAYPLGKSQEVTKLLTLHGVPVLQHPAVYAISRIYQACGVDLGDFSLFGGKPVLGHAVVTLPRGAAQFSSGRPGKNGFHRRHRVGRR